ncbi:hypothetical protein ACFL4Z_04365 [candidate division KSB1 bacterium]
MKKLLNLVAITALAVMVLLTLSVTGLSARVNNPEIKTFVDVDGDGIPNGLDPDFIRGTAQGGEAILNFIDEDGDGICDFYQTGRQGIRQYGKNARNMNFVDADGDGLCDNPAYQGRGFRNVNGNGMIFIDEDGDGVCDNYPNSSPVTRQFGNRQYKGGRNK